MRYYPNGPRLRDLALILDGICALTPGELWITTPPAHPYVATVRAAATGSLQRLRVGILPSARAGIRSPQPSRARWKRPDYCLTSSGTTSL